MRFLHTSDWHLGRTLHGVDLLDAQRAVLDQLRALVAEPPDGIPIDAVIVAGDIYDRAVPPVEAVTLFSDTLAGLVAHTTVIVTAGNHDSAIRLGFGSPLFTDRLRVRTELATIGEPVLLGAPGAGVAIYPLPYLDPDVARTVLATGQEPLHRSHQAVMSAAMDRVRTDLAGRPGMASIVIAHAFVVGGAVSESERSIVVGGVDSVAADTFDGVDYVALGHLHGAQQPRTGTGAVLRYSGSPLRYSFSELGHTKSVTLVELSPDGTVELRELPLSQPRRMADLTGTLDELLAMTGHTEDWVRLTVTDRARPDQLFDRVKSRFPQVLQVLHVPAGSVPAGSAPASDAVQRSPRELGGDFISHVTGGHASSDELALFEQAFQAALAETGAG
ncbi:MAG: exonuclease SbcCD subunit D [Actinomycetota bacterium]|nr:exonuclease SbcCD subunit D [Actinomycetota bacterium]MDQ2955951.1 exonuclease SbcCD subunit D [Actinomycetota bacterium]